MREMFEIHISFWNIALKNFRLSCIVSTQDAYYIADTKSMTGARYNSLTCSLLVTNLYHISQPRTFSCRQWRVQWGLCRQNERLPS